MSTQNTFFLTVPSAARVVHCVVGRLCRCDPQLESWSSQRQTGARHAQQLGCLFSFPTLLKYMYLFLQLPAILAVSGDLPLMLVT